MALRLLAILGMTLAGSIAPPMTASMQAAEIDPATSAVLMAHSDDRTIAVSVTDQASTTVDRVQMKYSFYDSGYYDYDTDLYVEPGMLPVEEIEAAVMTALSRAGIPSSAIDVSYADMGIYSSSEVSTIITLPASHAAIGNASEAMQSASEPFTGLTMQTVGVRLGTSQCDVMAEEARIKTIQLARERATLLADAIGVRLGDVISVHESYQDLIPYGAATCLETSGEFPPMRLSSYGGEWTMYMENAPLEVELSTTLDVTFATE